MDNFCFVHFKSYIRKVNDETAVLILGLNDESDFNIFQKRIKRKYRKTIVKSFKKIKDLDKETFMTRGFVIAND